MPSSYSNNIRSFSGSFIVVVVFSFHLLLHCRVAVAAVYKRVRAILENDSVMQKLTAECEARQHTRCHAALLRRSKTREGNACKPLFPFGSRCSVVAVFEAFAHTSCACPLHTVIISVHLAVVLLSSSSPHLLVVLLLVAAAAVSKRVRAIISGSIPRE